MTIESMTGYGAGAAETPSGKASAEVKTLNNRFADVSIRLPNDLMSLEMPVRERVQRAIKRGKASVSICWKSASGAADGPRFSEERLHAIVEQWEALSERLRLPRLTAEAIAAMPGALAVDETEKSQSVSEEVEQTIFQALDEALGKLAEARRAEGARLAADLRERLAAVEKLTAQIEERSGEALESGREKLRKRWEEFSKGAGIAVEPGRVEMELLALADRSDITEELVRLRAHIAAFGELLRDKPDDDSAGRRMDFLLQEFGRETNTISSKARDISIAPLALEMKHELEKMREQVQNLA
jgi:uncharacterized protein (TIGR00255 family)